VGLNERALMLEEKVRVTKLMEIALVVVLLSFAAFRLYHFSIQQFPSHVHAWTQSDRYALTIGYVENGMNLLLPSTLNLAPKYPPKFPKTSETGITKADLPLTEYISAALMKLTGTKIPVIHRLVTLGFGLAGLVFLMLVFRSAGASFSMALLVMMLAMLAPVHAYYLNGFIPSIPALALSFAALWFFVRHQKQNRMTDYAVALSLAVLAAMIRPPFLMFLLSLALAQTIMSLLNGGRLKAQLLLLLAVVVVFAALQWHNQYLSVHYGSLFITGLQPAEGVGQTIDLLRLSISNWQISYFSHVQYLVLALAVFLLLINIKQIIYSQVFPLMIVALSLLLASFLYFLTMAKQFPDHDYYFLDSFFLPLVLIAGAGLSLPKPDTLLRKGMQYVVTALLAILMFDAAAKELEKRYTSHNWDRTEQTRILFDGSAAFLDAEGISRDAKILVLDAYTTNGPLLLMQRKGFTVINTNAEQLGASLEHPFDYVVIPNRTLSSDVLRNMPLLRQQLQPIANNGNIGLYTIQKGHQPRSGFELLMPKALPFEQYKVPDTLLCTGSEAEFAMLAETDVQLDGNYRYALFFDAETLHAEAANQLQIVMDLSGNNSESFYDAFPLNTFFVSGTHPEAFLNIPDGFHGVIRLKCYLWNPTSANVCLNKPRIYLLKYLI
jgi:hypothetical protein